MPSRFQQQSTFAVFGWCKFPSWGDQESRRLLLFADEMD